ncbi:MAG: hypothetical protein GKR94_05815 [Gammaproteobacteria bacterium]|nr:hypothetical protein [Gammaproteobacteria bacterium]
MNDAARVDVVQGATPIGANGASSGDVTLCCAIWKKVKSRIWKRSIGIENSRSVLLHRDSIGVVFDWLWGT